MRIKANELRIGNLVNIEDIENPCCISGIMENACMVYELKDFTIAYRYLEPIPLTEEWLIRFGFNGQPSDYGKDKLSVCLKGSDKFHIEGRVYYKDWAIIESQPKYVHEWQNLYFALTNQELEFLKAKKP